AGAGATAAGGAVCWGARDAAPGTAPAEIERVFRKGAATRPGQGARGLGLSIVEQVVEAHGGRIAVESATGLGATFWFELPAESPPPPAH
ncbi:MAG: HAMP domain-containing histidine kinase, partial [Burkholderiales bacterium]|nr:HAMP domain-containing histidine kinase [Burkholderiales bacterium]